MGGQGSGRKPGMSRMFDAPKQNVQFSEGQKSKGLLDDFAERQNIDTREGTIQKVPVDAKDIVNKEYVDSTVGGGVELYLTEDDSSDIGATYKQLVPFPTGAGKEDTVTAINSAAAVKIEEYATEVGCGCVSVLTSIPEGVVRLHLHAKGEVASRLKLYYELYKRDNLDDETLLGTSDISSFLTTSEVGYDIHLTLTSETTWVSTDRIVLKLYGTSTLVVNKDLTIYCEGNTASRTRITGEVPVGHNVTASSALTDETIVQGDGGVRGVKTSTATVAQIASALQNVVEDTTPELGGEMDAGAHTIGFTQQSTTGDGTTTIDWKLGNKFYFTFGAQADTFTFTAPSNPCNLILVLKQDGTGSRIPTFPASVHWSGGSMPTFSTGANAVDIVAFYYDGTNYFGVETLDFS